MQDQHESSSKPRHIAHASERGARCEAMRRHDTQKRWPHAVVRADPLPTSAAAADSCGDAVSNCVRQIGHVSSSASTSSSFASGGGAELSSGMSAMASSPRKGVGLAPLLIATKLNRVPPIPN